MNAVGQVAAGIAHDFGNLLAVARNSVSRLQELAPVDHRARETLDVLARTVEEATSITQSLLVFTRRLPAERQHRLGEYRDALLDLRDANGARIAGEVWNA